MIQIHPVPSKQTLRSAAKQKRSAIPKDEIAEKSVRICDYLFGLVDGCDPVMVYVSKLPEVDTHPLIAGLLRKGRRVIVPIIETDTRTLRLSYLMDPSLLVKSTFHVPEPIGNEIPAKASDIRTIIIPMLAFDRRGNRLGYGAGYYDRFLKQNPGAKKIGVAFSCQETESVPGDENDIRVDMVVTEDGIIHCTRE
ncbi:MAG: 5-formyltetrahydrofolate cyclo-ligase [Methanoregula sp.]|nr:MAG: 5-formyltetrahydrofolate cyclo-ligase [Methanoregula sp.]